MKQGELWTVAVNLDYGRKPRPAVIVQADRYRTLESITVCLISSDNAEGFDWRVPLMPSSENGLSAASFIMTDKVVTVPRSRLGRRIGQLSHAERERLSSALLAFFDLAGRSAK